MFSSGFSWIDKLKTKEIIEIIRKNHNVGNNHIVIDK